MRPRGYNEASYRQRTARPFFAEKPPVLRPLQVACMHQLFSRPLPTFPAARHPARRLPLGLATLALTALSACSSVSDKLPSVGSVVTPYKIDIVQGNVVTREQAQALRPGMAREQVRDLLGSPLLTSVFHADRWDYVFTFRRQGQPTQSRRLTVFFKDSALERFESDELPSEAEFVASLDSNRKPGKVPPLEATEAQLKAFEASNAAASQASTKPPAVAPATSYPPLEAAGAVK
jgi:outer membrane protein assembly factor BamE